MDFALSYSGTPGDLSATLTSAGKPVAYASGLKDGKAVRKWADRIARDHKVASTPEATDRESVSISGSSTFSL